MSTKSEEKLRVAREVLEWLDKRGGLGHDAHDRIKTALEYEGDRQPSTSKVLDVRVEQIVELLINQKDQLSQLALLYKRQADIDANITSLLQIAQRAIINSR